MWIIWRLYDPLRAMVLQGIFLFGLAAKGRTVAKFSTL